MKKMFLKDAQINAMADAALMSYEISADRRSAFDAAHEYCVDNFGVSPTVAQVALAYKIAMARWQGIVQATKREISQEVL